MHNQTIERLTPNHDFVKISKKNQFRVILVLIITAITMLVEIVAGLWYGSMALLADGWHMSTHLIAFGITLFAWYYADKKRNDPSYSFSTGKVSVLSGFTSAIFLAVVAVLMAVESITRFFHPHDIAFDQAIMIAIIGLVVNVVSAFLLHQDHSVEQDPLAAASHSHGGHSHAAHSHSHGGDHNHRAAFLHVLADALTSVAAIIALLAGKWYGWNWMDPMMGIIGAIIILVWAKSLMTETASILLDKSADESVRDSVKETLEDESGDKVIDFHIWKVSNQHYAAIIALVSDQPLTPEAYKEKLSDFIQLSHITIEVNPCDDESCIARHQ